MSDDRDIIVEVDGVHLCELTGSGDCLQDAHCHGNLHIALYCARRSLFDQHRKCRDKHTVKYACLALCISVIVRSDKPQLLVFYPLFERNNVFCHLPYFFDASAALDIKCVQDILCLRTDRLLVCNIVGDRPHLLPVELFCVQVHSSVQI